MHPSHAGFGGEVRRRNSLSWEEGASVVPQALDRLIERLAPCPWVGHAGGHPFEADASGLAHARPIYTPEERRRRDDTPWTMVQGVLAPLQFLAFGVSVVLIARFMATGRGLALAEASVVVKAGFLYAIMITGSIWEKKVFGRWLFAPSFFWEDAVSMLVLALQTTYLAALITGWGSPREQLTIAVLAYGAYAANAAQFLLKLRAARLEGSPAGRLRQA